MGQTINHFFCILCIHPDSVRIKMKKISSFEIIIFSAFNILRLLLLISIILLFIKDPCIVSDNNDIIQFKIFIFTLTLFCIDYLAGTISSILQFINEKKIEQFWSINSALLMMIILLLMITNNDPEDMLKSSAALMLFLMLKYITGFTPHTVDKNNQ